MKITDDTPGHQHSSDSKDEKESYSQGINDKGVLHTTANNHGSQPHSNRNIFDESIKDYSCLLNDFLNELEVKDSNKSQNESEPTIYKADVVFFAKELQWRFETMKTLLDSFMRNADNKVDYSSLAIVPFTLSASMENKNIKTNFKESNKEMQDENTSDDNEVSPDLKTNGDSTPLQQPNKTVENDEGNLTKVERKCEGTQTESEKVNVKELENVFNNEIEKLQNECNTRKANIETLQISLQHKKEELENSNRLETDHRKQLLHAKSRLKYLEIALNANLRHQRYSLSPRLVDAIATKSILNDEQKEDCISCGTKVIEEQKQSPIIEEMRKKIVELASALETSEEKRAVLYDERLKEKEQSSKLITMLGENVKELMRSQQLSPAKANIDYEL